MRDLTGLEIKALKLMMTSHGFEIFLSLLEDKIKRYSNIKKIDKENVEKSFLINRSKVDIYEGFINDLNNIVSKNKKGGKK